MGNDRAAMFDPSPGQEKQASNDKGADETSEPIPVTLDQVQDIATKAATEASESVFRKAQGLIDTNINRVEGQVQAGLSALEQVTELYKEAGLEVPPEIVERARGKVVVKSFEFKPDASDADTSGEKPGQAKLGETQPTDKGGEPDTVNEIAKGKMVAAGVNITRASKSFPLIDLETEDPVVFLASVDKAIEAEKLDPSSEGDPANLKGVGDETPDQRRARMASLASGGAGTGASLPDLPTGEDYLDLGYSQSPEKEAPSEW